VCDDIRLREVGGPGKWAYVVQFVSEHKSQTMAADGNAARATLPFLVYLDGAVQPPEAPPVETHPVPPNVVCRLVEGLRPKDIKDFVRPYEPTQLGFTKDDGDRPFMDFSFSAMFPISGAYPAAEGRSFPELPKYTGRDFDFQKWNLFFSATIRGGQYIGTRPSSPVVGKRFNPQLFFRFWGRPDDDNKTPTSADNYLDFIFFGHESNGQSIGDPVAFNAQREVYRQIEPNPTSTVADERSRLSARDAISRGWDYVGLEWAWGENRQSSDRKLGMTARLKLRYFLPVGIAQGHAEQYEAWEGFPVGQPRRYYDGVTLRLSNTAAILNKAVPLFTGRQTLTYTTGYGKLGRHNTFEYEIGMKIGALPVSIWTRYGYNSDLTDYYLKGSSSGFRISIWDY
jgi:hypothetical protein